MALTRQEYLLICLGEECDEVGQRVTKALRFGLSEVQPGQPLNNGDRILEEVHDLLSVLAILQREGVLPSPPLFPDTIAAKLAKIEKFMAISREQGILP
jgi:hypothetical protein